MVRKSVRTMLGICCAVLVLANSPTVKADGHESDEAKLPKMFELSDRGEGMSDEAVSRLRIITGIHRLQKMAAADQELSALKYSNPEKALGQLGVDVPDDVAISITKNDESGEDEVTVSENGVSSVRRFDSRGDVSTTWVEQRQYPRQNSGFTSRAAAPDDILTVMLNGGYAGNAKGIFPCGFPYETAAGTYLLMAADYNTWEEYWAPADEICPWKPEDYSWQAQLDLGGS